MPLTGDVVHVHNEKEHRESWWAYISPIPPEPLPPKRKVVQTLWMVPQTWYVGGTASTALHSANWFGPDDTIPPGAIETVQKREVEQ